MLSLGGTEPCPRSYSFFSRQFVPEGEPRSSGIPAPESAHPSGNRQASDPRLSSVQALFINGNPRSNTRMKIIDK
jgi:hypothetical protein